MKSVVTFLNSNLGVLILSSVVIAPIGWAANNYLEGQKRAAEEQKRVADEEAAAQKQVEKEEEAAKKIAADERRRYHKQVDKLCGEILRRLNQLRDINISNNLSTSQWYQLYIAVPNALPPPLAIAASFPEFEKMPTAAVLGELEAETLADATLRPMVSTIRREHDKALFAFQRGERATGIEAVRQQVLGLIGLRAEMENRLTSPP
jgi:hypothetical protein